MDPVTLAAVLIAVVTGASEALGGQLLTGLASLVRRPWHRKTPADDPAALPPGQAELTALQRSPRDPQKAAELAQALLARADTDAGFGQALHQWWEHAERVRVSLGDVTNTVSGGTQYGPVLQGRDFTNLTFGTAQPPYPPARGSGHWPVSGTDAGDTSNRLAGGIQLGPVIQVRDVHNPTFNTVQAAAAPVALAQLPAPVTGFTGRETELAEVTGLLDPAAKAGAVVVSAVAGLAGVGKTALAIQAAHAARANGWFGGGVLFLNLHGYDDQAVQPERALDALLRALGVLAEHIPPETEERAGLYRSALAAIGEPLLLVADNASSEAQVRPLLPGVGPHRVLIAHAGPADYKKYGPAAPMLDSRLLVSISKEHYATFRRAWQNTYPTMLSVIVNNSTYRR